MNVGSEREAKLGNVALEKLAWLESQAMLQCTRCGWYGCLLDYPRHKVKHG